MRHSVVETVFDEYDLERCFTTRDACESEMGPAQSPSQGKDGKHYLRQADLRDLRK